MGNNLPAANPTEEEEEDQPVSGDYQAFQELI